MTRDASANNDFSTPKTTRQAGLRRTTWIALVVILAATSLLGAAWLLRGCAAKADECVCEDRMQSIINSGFHGDYPPAPELSPEDVADRENQLARRVDAFLLGKAEIVGKFVTTTQVSLASVASVWRFTSSRPCWEYYADYAPLPDGLNGVQVVRSTCGHHDLFAFAEHMYDIDEGRYNTWGFFRLRLKDGAS